jgi:hypothetical protein
VLRVQRVPRVLGLCGLVTDYVLGGERSFAALNAKVC